MQALFSCRKFPQKKHLTSLRCSLPHEERSKPQFYLSATPAAARGGRLGTCFLSTVRTPKVRTLAIRNVTSLTVNAILHASFLYNMYYVFLSLRSVLEPFLPSCNAALSIPYIF